MKIDYERRRPLEIEGIIGNPLRMAREAGIKLPKMGMLYQQLKFLDTRNIQNFSS
jgi:2-dehydropantoate 2-reductase